MLLLLQENKQRRYEKLQTNRFERSRRSASAPSHAVDPGHSYSSEEPLHWQEQFNSTMPPLFTPNASWAFPSSSTHNSTHLVSPNIRHSLSGGLRGGRGSEYDDNGDDDQAWYEGSDMQDSKSFEADNERNDGKLYKRADKYELDAIEEAGMGRGSTMDDLLQTDRLWERRQPAGEMSVDSDDEEGESKDEKTDAKSSQAGEKRGSRIKKPRYSERKEKKKKLSDEEEGFIVTEADVGALENYLGKTCRLSLINCVVSPQAECAQKGLHVKQAILD
jgi:hypothetical protein